MSRAVTIKVVMRRHNMSGRRMGAVLTLDEPLAKDWLARGWCDRVVEEPKPEPVEKPKAKTVETR